MTERFDRRAFLKIAGGGILCSGLSSLCACRREKDTLLMNRFAVAERVPLRAVEAWLRFDRGAVLKEELRKKALNALKIMLGNRRYERARRWFLGLAE